MRRGGDRLLLVLLLGLLVGLVLLVTHHKEGEIAGLGLDQFGQMVVLLSIAIFIGAGIWGGWHSRMMKSLKAALFWCLIAALLAVVYTYRDQMRAVGERVMGELVPGYVVSSGTGPLEMVEITRSSGGGFSVHATINGASLTMLVDTGASSVVLTQDDAREAGLPLEFLTYDIPVDTANGRVRAAAVVLDNIIVGGIVERQVPALVSPPGALRSSLLGMSFLRRLDGFEFRGDRLILRGIAAP
ncbi:MAG: TIGR02281 family clan AA aspartic protease [Xanthobacter sp.]